MDRLEWSSPDILPGESKLASQARTKLYDGDVATGFKDGDLTLTSHRLLWTSPSPSRSCLSLDLRLVVFLEEEAGTLTGSPKIVLFLTAPSAHKRPGPVQSSRATFIKVSFKLGGQAAFVSGLNRLLEEKPWTQPTASFGTGHSPSVRAGITGIERSLQQKVIETDASISSAFQDLSNLMAVAEEMVHLAKEISQKIKNQRGAVSEDETVQFRSQLLSLGVDDPVTRDAVSSHDEYYRKLAKEISSVLLVPIEEAGGMMPLADAYCRINRARGLQLISPDDLIGAGKAMTSLNWPLRLREFPSGLRVLQLDTLDDEVILASTLQDVDARGSLSADELAKERSIPVVLALERLLLTESKALVARDDVPQGLRFYPNWFLHPPN
ncbi:unnamed protein product [Cyprideis torosa]|uniref:Vacuolar protein-sorting-associated protein 36 n=1 Tax=Cyprideis torosa TaxID=163714 RepID=A0A7R8WAW5_9CRUS|nr:unnamed protein product [Cyprideis torosa]CAG0885723.1 unnamed protein product [Cyprideis torosa]